MPGYFGTLAVAPSAPPSEGTITKIRGAYKGGQTSLSMSAAELGGAPVEGDLMVACVAIGNVTNPATGVSATGWSLATSAWNTPNNNGVDPSIGIWYKVAGSSEPGPWVFSQIAGQAVTIHVDMHTFRKDFPGTWTPGVTDSAEGAASTTPTTGSTLSVDASNHFPQVAIAAVGLQNNSGGSEAATDGFTAFNPAATTNRVLSAHKIITADEMLEPTLTWLTARRWAAALATFYVAI